MNLSNYFWYFKSALTPRFCDEVIKYALQQKDGIARTGGFDTNQELSKEDIKNIQRKRKSDLVWFNDTWIYKELHPYVHEANRRAGWNFDWDRSVSLANLQNINKVNIMIGIVTVGIKFIKEKKDILKMVR